MPQGWKGQVAQWPQPLQRFFANDVTLLSIYMPPVLLSGNHEHIRRWRRQLSLVRTRQRRPDLFGSVQLTDEDRRLLAAWDTEHSLRESLEAPT